MSSQILFTWGNFNIRISKSEPQVKNFRKKFFFPQHSIFILKETREYPGMKYEYIPFFVLQYIIYMFLLDSQEAQHMRCKIDSSGS